MNDLDISTVGVVVTGYKGQKYTLHLGDHVADENGRGGKAVWIAFDTTLKEYVIGAMPSSGPSYELRGSQISFVAPPDPEEGGNV